MRQIHARARERFREGLETFRGSSPGRRFQDLNRRREHTGHAAATKLLYICAGLLTVCTGIASYTIPGFPSTMTVLLGLALFSQGSMHGARALDWVELRIERPLYAALRGWALLPVWVRVVAVLGWVLFVASVMYLLIWRA